MRAGAGGVFAVSMFPEQTFIAQETTARDTAAQQYALGGELVRNSIVGGTVHQSKSAAEKGNKTRLLPCETGIKPYDIG